MTIAELTSEELELVAGGGEIPNPPAPSPGEMPTPPTARLDTERLKEPAPAPPPPGRGHSGTNSPPAAL